MTQIVLVGHCGELFKDPFQIRIRVFAEDTTVLDHGVEYGTASAGFLTSDIRKRTPISSIPPCASTFYRIERI